MALVGEMDGTGVRKIKQEQHDLSCGSSAPGSERPHPSAVSPHSTGVEYAVRRIRVGRPLAAACCIDVHVVKVPLGLRSLDERRYSVSRAAYRGYRTGVPVFSTDV